MLNRNENVKHAKFKERNSKKQYPQSCFLYSKTCMLTLSHSQPCRLTTKPPCWHALNFCFTLPPSGQRYRKAQERRNVFILSLTFSRELVAEQCICLHISMTLSQNDHRVRHLGTSSISNNKILKIVCPHHRISGTNKCTYRMDPDSYNITAYSPKIVFLLNTWTRQEWPCKEVY